MVDFELLLSEPSEGVLVMNLSGELDMATVEPLREASRTALASGDYNTLVFDLTQLEFIDSTGLHVLTDAHREITLKGGQVRMVCPKGNIRTVLELSGLDKLFIVVGERTLALSA
jgi:stage II sporulation protein AA (anti-sigma F factor antagonist)